MGGGAGDAGDTAGEGQGGGGGDAVVSSPLGR